MSFSGRIMGTYYAITLVRRPPKIPPEALHEKARAELERVEALMSTYRPDSEVGLINASVHCDWLPISPETVKIIHQALEIGRITGGAYDITAGPLVNLWGFGPEKRPSESIPDEAAIAAVRQHVGIDLLEVRLDPPAVRKKNPQVRIDLASIAKGFGVDQAARILEREGVEDYCVDAGGEVLARGFNSRGILWQVAIEAPEAGRQTIHRLLALRDQSIATSGDYRIFVEQNGTRYSHIIDPRTGHPVRHNVVSLTVLHPSCATADAWATALMVLGPEAGFELAVRQGLAALFLLKTGDGIIEKRTPQFDRIT